MTRKGGVELSPVLFRHKKGNKKAEATEMNKFKIKLNVQPTQPTQSVGPSFSIRG